MNIDQRVIDLATRIQRRRDFLAHVTGLLCGVVILGALLITGIEDTWLYLATVLTWATALSLQHFRQLLRGPVTARAVRAEATRPAAISRPDGKRNNQPPAGDTAARPRPNSGPPLSIPAGPCVPESPAAPIGGPARGYQELSASSAAHQSRYARPKAGPTACLSIARLKVKVRSCAASA